VGPQHEISFISPFWRLEFWGCSYISFFICAHHVSSSNILWSVSNEPFIWMKWVVVIKKKKFSLFLAKLRAMRAFGVAEVKFHEFLNPALEWELLLRHISYSDNTRISKANAILMGIWILLTKLHDTSKNGECVRISMFTHFFSEPIQRILFRFCLGVYSGDFRVNMTCTLYAIRP
jgi:hypothetical protein